MDHIVRIPEDTILLSEKYIETAHRGVKRASDDVSRTCKRLAVQKAKCESAEAAHGEAQEKLREWRGVLDHALLVGKKVLYGQALTSPDRLPLNSEDEELDEELYSGPCLLYSLDAQHTKRLVDKSPFVKRSHIVGNSVLTVLEESKRLKARVIRNMDYHNIVTVNRVPDRPRTTAANMFTNRRGFANALDRVIGASLSNEGKVLFSRELLLEMGVSARGVRWAIQAIGNTANGRVYVTDELLYLNTEGAMSSPTVVIANPITYRSKGVFCALADPKEALIVLGRFIPGLVNERGSSQFGVLG